MPELPEVETFKKALEPALLNRTILSINLIYEKTISTNKDEFLSILKNKKITKLGRKGKFLLFFLSSPYVLISHLRMEGKFFVEPKEEKRKKHDLVEFNLDNDTKLVYNDVRKFGFIGLYKASSYLKDSPLSNLGKEPFEISKEELFIGLHKRKAEIKEALLDQTIMSGLGNIYDDEVLFDCKINPRTPSNQISLSQAQNIISSSIKILNKAIEKNGSTIKSFHFKENQNGDMQNFLKVYGKEHTPCPNCLNLFHKIKIGGRGTTYCPYCQENPYRPFVIGITGPIHSGKSTASNYFLKKGFVIFNADKEVANLYKQEVIKKHLIDLFGKDVINKNEIDKAKLTHLLQDKNNKKALMDYLYPILYKKAEEFINKASSNVILDVPLLYSSHLDNLTDFVILIDSNLENRKSRIEKEGRDSISLLKINATYPLNFVKKKASIIIDNDQGLLNLYKQLDLIKIPNGYKYQ